MVITLLGRLARPVIDEAMRQTHHARAAEATRLGFNPFERAWFMTFGSGTLGSLPEVGETEQRSQASSTLPPDNLVKRLSLSFSVTIFLALSTISRTFLSNIIFSISGICTSPLFYCSDDKREKSSDGLTDHRNWGQGRTIKSCITTARQGGFASRRSSKDRSGARHPPRRCARYSWRRRPWLRFARV